MGCSSVNNGGESGGKVRVVAKAAGNAIAMAAATVVAALMGTVPDGCIGGLAMAAAAVETMMARDDGQHQHSTPHFTLTWMQSVCFQQVPTHFRPNQAHKASPKMF